MVNNLHYNFIMTGSLSEKHTLFAEECFTNLFDCFETLLNISGIRNTRVSVYQAGAKKAKHGKIRWDKQELLRIVTDDELIPLMLAIEAPSIKSSYNKGTTPEVYILCPMTPCANLLIIAACSFQSVRTFMKVSTKQSSKTL